VREEEEGWDLGECEVLSGHGRELQMVVLTFDGSGNIQALVMIDAKDEMGWNIIPKPCELYYRRYTRPKGPISTPQSSDCYATM